ncbi:MAG: hypothetical protein KUG79_15830 [Pseudomonadales bacterium]|nr:hypothetical protein [Pseudomonadales bacterium]
MRELHKKFMISAVVCTAILSSVLVRAESFSFTSISKVTNQIMMPTPAGGYMGSIWASGKSKVIDSIRGKITHSFECALNTKTAAQQIAWAG